MKRCCRRVLPFEGVAPMLRRSADREAWNPGEFQQRRGITVPHRDAAPMARPTPVSGFVLRANRRSPAPAGGLFVAFTLLVGTSLAAIGVAVLVGGSLPAFAGWFVI